MNAHRIILQGVVGSQAYGLSTPQSDVDRLGIWQALTEDVLSLNPPKESIVEHAPLPDRTLHELSKFIRLALAANPTVLELLWLEDFEKAEEAGFNLVWAREKFLSQRIRNTYGGYAESQRKRLVERDGSFASDLRNRTEKHGRHCYRLILQGGNALREGKLRVKLTEDEAQECREAGQMAANDVEGFSKMATSAIQAFDSIPSDLPLEPDRSEIDDLLVRLRLKDLR